MNVRGLQERSPCKHCTEETGRYPGCHSKCDAYISFRSDMDEMKEKISKGREHYYEQKPTNFFKKKTIRLRNKHGQV